jgi:hypothetical protein
MHPSRQSNFDRYSPTPGENIPEENFEFYRLQDPSEEPPTDIPDHLVESSSWGSPPLPATDNPWSHLAEFEPPNHKFGWEPEDRNPAYFLPYFIRHHHEERHVFYYEPDLVDVTTGAFTGTHATASIDYRRDVEYGLGTITS